MHSQTLISCYSTLTLLVIKDIRFERHVHQGALAQYTGRTPNAWTKIENGQTTLSMDALFGVCTALSVQPSYIMTIVERLVPIFNNGGWYFQTVTLGSEEDSLLRLILKYYASKGYEHLSKVSLGPVNPKQSIEEYFSFSLKHFYQPPTVVRYCCDHEFREWIDNGAQRPFKAIECSWELSMPAALPSNKNDAASA